MGNFFLAKYPPKNINWEYAQLQIIENVTYNKEELYFPH